MADNESPLVQALPPKSDYLTYLTIVEYNLKTDNLPILHTVLQDEKLTTNIGWDLVHLLVPLLPESEQCLKDVAHLGNPREVILKVTESLRLIEFDDIVAEDSIVGGDEDDDVRTRAESSTFPQKTAPVKEAAGPSEPSQATELPPALPLPVLQFRALLSMLAILHPRIKTKYPSRFLSTTLQAILASFSNSSEHREEMIEAIAETVKAISGVQRPSLPSRRSSGFMKPEAPTRRASGADPEAGEASAPSVEEQDLQKRLLQAFTTHVLEEYLLNISRYDDVPGMAWCSRIMEKIHPERQIPDVPGFAHCFTSEEELQRRSEAVGQLVALAKDIQITDHDLLETAITVEKVPGPSHDEEEPPKTAKEVPLSRLGSVLLYAARKASAILYSNSQSVTAPFTLFPDHHELLKNCLASADLGAGLLGTEPEALIDSVLGLSLICLEDNSIGAPDSDEDFNHYLQTNAFLSSNCPNPNLRGHAHYITTTVLRSQPDDKVRLDFIRDTLEHCPYENLKVSAVGWIKGETIEANGPTPVAGHDHEHSSEADGHDHRSVFATPYALDSLGAYLFPDLHADLVTAPIQDAWHNFQINVAFYLASLNFVYLLLSAKHVHQALEVSDLWKNHDVAGSFLQPLREARTRFAQELSEGGALASEGNESVLGELVLLDETIQQVTRAVTHLQSS